MQKNIIFSELFTKIIIVLLVILLVMIYLSERKNLTLEPSLLVLQTDYQEKKDRIIKTQNTLNDYQTIFENDDIQSFAFVNNYLIITTGKENQESTINLINLLTRQTKIISSNTKYISNILPSQNRFVFLVEDLIKDSRTYEGKLATLETDQESFSLINPSFLGYPAKNFFVHVNSSLVVFDGFGDKYYFLDLSTPDKATFVNLPTTKIVGFINPKQLVYYDNESYATQNFKILDLITNQANQIQTGINYTPDIAISSDTKKTFFLQPVNQQQDNIRGIRNLANNKIYNLTGQTINSLDLSSDNRYILLDKYIVGSIPNLLKKSFTIFDTQKETFLKSSVEGSFAIWSF